jgi:hypothetical protein
MIAAMRRTGPSDWRAGWQAVLFAACTVLAVAVMVVVVGALIRTLGLELRTKLPKKKVLVQPAVVSKPKPAVSKEGAARAKAADDQHLNGTVDTMFDDPGELTLEESPGEAGRRVEPVPALTPPSFLPPLPTAIDLDEARPVTPSEGSGHADRRTPRSRRIPAVPPSRRPGRRGGR